MSASDTAWLAQRSAGVLLHVSSLPGPGPCGDLGREANRFIDFLQEAGFGFWQMLPVGPTGEDGSPYQAISSHAGNPRFIALEPVAERGWLDPRDVGCGLVDDDAKRECLSWAFIGFKKYADKAARAEFRQFVADHSNWLDDFALFQTLHDAQGKAWWDWEPALRDREPKALAEVRVRLAAKVEQARFEQFLFFDQWVKLKSYAAARGVRLFGDLPIFVSHDSADVWAHPEFFFLDSACRPTVVAGVPPDYFPRPGSVGETPFIVGILCTPTGIRSGSSVCARNWVYSICSESTIFAALRRIGRYRRASRMQSTGAGLRVPVRCYSIGCVMSLVNCRW